MGGGREFMYQELGKFCEGARKERPLFFQGQSHRERANPWPLSSNPLRKAAMSPNNGPLSSDAQVLVTGKTFVAGETAMSEPAKSDARSDFQPLPRVAQFGNRPGHPMSRPQRVLGHAPPFVEH